MSEGGENERESGECEWCEFSCTGPGPGREKRGEERNERLHTAVSTDHHFSTRISLSDHTEKLKRTVTSARVGSGEKCNEGGDAVLIEEILTHCRRRAGEFGIDKFHDEGRRCFDGGFVFDRPQHIEECADTVQSDHRFTTRIVEGQCEKCGEYSCFERSGQRRLIQQFEKNFNSPIFKEKFFVCFVCNNEIECTEEMLKNFGL